MKTRKKILICLALVGIVFASGIVTYMFNGNQNRDWILPSTTSVNEKLMINNAYVNGSTIFLDVQSFKGNIQFNAIIIKNATRYVIDHTSISDSILEGQNKTISTKLNFTLASGKYIATLVTEKGSSFMSPSFNVP
jgi:PBP1b-binding outer membrane lipoprotein LpoB